MFYVEEHKPWRPSRNMIIVAAVLLVFWIGSMVASSMRTVPADEVVREWFQAMIGRQAVTAEDYVTPRMLQSLAERQNNLQMLSDDYYDRVVNGNARYRISKPSYSPPTDPKYATVAIAGDGNNGPLQVQVQMVKVGRQWKIDGVY